MKRNTRKDILDTAKQLFNERGFNNVSTQEIARVLGISKGNLTYHFNKKEEIIEALILEGPSREPPKSPQNLEELDQYFLHMHEVVQENAYYFWHHTQVAQLSPKIKEAQNKVYLDSVKKLFKSFYTLKAVGLLREECFVGEYERVIDTLHLSIIYWLPFCALKQKEKESASFRNQAWGSLYALLTDSGRQMLKSLVDIT